MTLFHILGSLTGNSTMLTPEPTPFTHEGREMQLKV